MNACENCFKCSSDVQVMDLDVPCLSLGHSCKSFTYNSTEILHDFLSKPTLVLR